MQSLSRVLCVMNWLMKANVRTNIINWIHYMSSIDEKIASSQTSIIGFTICPLLMRRYRPYNKHESNLPKIQSSIIRDRRLFLIKNIPKIQSSIIRDRRLFLIKNSISKSFQMSL
jgi:hypothetical protein